MSEKKQISHAAVIIWNYNTRGDSENDLKDKHDVGSTLYLTTEVVSIRTSRDKASPSGNFNIELAPSNNWTTIITPGSWCAILMSNNREAVTEKSANQQSLKMLGRVTSCRSSYTGNQQDGSVNVSFIVDGKDWGSIFETILYIDPIYRGSSLDPQKPLGMAAVLKSFQTFFAKKEKEGSFNLMRVGDVIRLLKTVWGPNESLLSLISNVLGSSSSERFNLASSPLNTFSKGGLTLPKEVSSFLGSSFGGSIGFGGPTNIVSILQDVEGRLKKYDTYDYSNSVNDGVGIPDLSPMFGMNSVWSIMQSNCNHILNEMIPEMRWDGNSASLSLYRRIRPFCTRERFEGSSDVEDLISLFKNIKRHSIDVKDIISFNAGTNWRDRINFIEVRSSLYDLKAMSSAIKGNAQIFDKESIDRDGFKALPMNLTTSFYLPFEVGSNSNTAAIADFVSWKYLLKEWHFNSHTLLNGSLVIIGQDQYIGVGDNIMVPASVFGSGSFNSSVDNQKDFFLAHVEYVEHNFTVSETGTRQFFTTIRFVRGVFTDQEGNAVADSSGSIGGLIPNPFSSSFGGIGGDPLSRSLDKESNNSLKMPDDGTKNHVTRNTSKNNPKVK